MSGARPTPKSWVPPEHIVLPTDAGSTSLRVVVQDEKSWFQRHLLQHVADELPLGGIRFTHASNPEGATLENVNVSFRYSSSGLSSFQPPPSLERQASSQSSLLNTPIAFVHVLTADSLDALKGVRDQLQSWVQMQNANGYEWFVVHATRRAPSRAARKAHERLAADIFSRTEGDRCTFVNLSSASSLRAASDSTSIASPP